MCARSVLLWLCLATFHFGLGRVVGQVPFFISHQGRVLVQGAPFQGTGQFKFSLVDPTGNQTFWSHDGTGVNGAEPVGVVPVTVVQGGYEIRLGDLTVPGMTAAVSPGILANSGVRLRVWFSDGVHGFERLIPDGALGSTPYALLAGQALSAGIAQTVADGAITSAKLAPGAVLADLAGSDVSAVGSGGMILANTLGNPALLDAGFVERGTAVLGSETWEERTPGAGLLSARYRHSMIWTGSEVIIWGGTNQTSLGDGARYDPALNRWRLLNSGGAPTPRNRHTAVWTGSYMVVWGGSSGNFFNSGGRYSPETDTWLPVSLVDAPTPRERHTAVWADSVMVVWGGSTANGFVSTGARYNPVTDAWGPMSTVDAPSPRANHTAIWTGREVIQWGGFSGGAETNSGGMYNPSFDFWMPMSTVDAPAGRQLHTAIWAGVTSPQAEGQMIVWGGFGNGFYFDSGGRFHPGLNQWSVMNFFDAPNPRDSHTAVWTGTEMIVWGGSDDSVLYSTGGRYHPDTDTWVDLAPSIFPGPRDSHRAVWTGTEMIVWGGLANELLNDGGRFDPLTDRWITVTFGDVPEARVGQSAVWTGVEMVVWGGENSARHYDTGGRYNPALNRWLRLPVIGAPARRIHHSAVWTGADMIIWGGENESGFLNSGHRYRPSVDQWIPISLEGSPTPRARHTAVYSTNASSEMIIWGGWNGGALGDGARYRPAADSWESMASLNAPTPRARHTAVWTGSEMIIWGGEESGAFLESGARYFPNADAGFWTSLPTAAAPEGRVEHSAVWTGSEMIIWGGTRVSPLSTGARFQPTSNTWVPVGFAAAPGPRARHTAVWTGAEMVVWGGVRGATYLGDGARYSPTLNTWLPVSKTGAPSPRADHSAVWSDTQMIVWGGSDGQSNLDSTFVYTPMRTLFLYARP